MAGDCGASALEGGRNGYMLGIDEAGRGPVLGPLVYAVCFCPVSRAGDLRKMGVADSKTLGLEKRELYRSKIEESEWLEYRVDVLMPKQLSAKMLRKHKYNLNLISHDSAIQLVQRAIDEGFDIEEVNSFCKWMKLLIAVLGLC
jgi:ribonuclease H2 subunit A